MRAGPAQVHLPFPLYLTPYEQRLLVPIERRNTHPAQPPRTLKSRLDRWCSFIDRFDYWQHYFEDFADHVMGRETVEFDFLPVLSAETRMRISRLVEPYDSAYVARTAPVSQPWFGRGNFRGSWWYRCPPHWVWFRQYGDPYDPRFAASISDGHSGPT